MEQRSQPALVLATQQAPVVQGDTQASPTVTAKVFRQLARVRYGIGLSRFLGELNAKSGGERSLWNKRRTIWLDKRMPALPQILRMKRPAIKLGEIEIGTKQPG